MISVCRLEKQHIEAVAEIERECFSQPWSQSSLELFVGGGGVGFVALVDGEVAAYGGMMCVLDEGQITNIATRKEYRRKGLGAAIMSAIEEFCRESGISDVYLEVRLSNVAAQSLYLSCGYEKIGERRAFYSAPVEDAVLMRLTVNK